MTKIAELLMATEFDFDALHEEIRSLAAMDDVDEAREIVAASWDQVHFAGDWRRWQYVIMTLDMVGKLLALSPRQARLIAARYVTRKERWVN